MTLVGLDGRRMVIWLIFPNQITDTVIAGYHSSQGKGFFFAIAALDLGAALNLFPTHLVECTLSFVPLYVHTCHVTPVHVHAPLVFLKEIIHLRHTGFLVTK